MRMSALHLQMFMSLIKDFAVLFSLPTNIAWLFLKVAVYQNVECLDTLRSWKSSRRCYSVLARLNEMPDGRIHTLQI